MGARGLDAFAVFYSCPRGAVCVVGSYQDAATKHPHLATALLPAEENIYRVFCKAEEHPAAPHVCP
jgi:hypothetical protein